MTALKSENEMSLQDLAALLGSDKKQDFAVPASQVSTFFDGDKGAETTMRFNTTPFGMATTDYDMTDHAVSQFHGRLANGFKTYSEELRSKGMGETYRNNIHDLLRDDNRTFRVRTLLNDQHEDRKVRAVVSDKFKPIDDDVVFGAALPLINPDRFEGIGGNKTDVRTVAKFIERTPSVSIQSGDRERHFHLGFILNNSEVGAGSASFSMFMSDSFCKNGCIFSKEVLANISYRHIGSRIDVRHGLIAESVVQTTELASIRNMIEQATTSAMSLKGREKIMASIQSAANRTIEIDHAKFFTDFGKATGLTKDETKELPLYANSDEFNQLGIQSAVTALAQHKPYERRLQLETIGGNVLMMGDRKWNSLAA